ncbi:bifunctional metallophosphatase/5'-nucleotidase [Anaerobacillus alkaliphilus]|uniref:Bifunctional metallophosphatase/5'-nucleotidase n=1 Tax=Anaerobacillus alkaliphilus TaxID=1548597 RepID=A0A4Q0VTP0_9BACI|nr:bifunctional UDP-sugar hydrolase/5'-nucleotidase [Anaerobacillus alkaliphilus]RXJ01803.1 bifunctional metallophosphatase/5'-nucleotidase [Anaerobacillus alkaliphilus]
MGTHNIEIFFTNDLHSHLEQWPKIITLLNGERNYFKEKGHDVFIFDIGDHVDRFHPLSEASMGKANVLLMNEVGYDSATIGNNEGITLPKEELCQLYTEAQFPVVVANLFELNGQRPTWVKPYQILQVNSGLRIGVIGLTMPYRPFYEALGWEIEDPYKILPTLVKEVKQQADLVILLSHLGLNFDEDIANQVDGIDIILGGHTHHVLENGLLIKDTIIHQAGKFGTYVGQLSFSYEPSREKITDFKARCIEVSNFPPCLETVQYMKDLASEQHSVLDTKVGIIESPLNISWEKPSSFASLLASAIKQWCGGEIGMINSGLLLEDLHEGVVTKGDLHRVCPHPINPCKVELSGKVLKEVILHSLSKDMIYKKVRGFGFRGEVMGIMVFDGVTYEQNSLADGLSHIFNIRVNGREIDYRRTYQVATLDMFTFGHLYPSIAAAKVKKYYMPELLRDILAWKLKDNNEL